MARKKAASKPAKKPAKKKAAKRAKRKAKGIRATARKVSAAELAQLPCCYPPIMPE